MNDNDKSSDFLDVANKAIERSNEGAEGVNGEIFPGHEKTRSVFIGAIGAILLLPVALYTLVTPADVSYTVGILLPVSILVWKCFVAKGLPASEAIPLGIVRFLYCVFFVIAIFLHTVVGYEFALAWYLSGFIYLLFESNVRRLVFSLPWV